MNRVGGGGRSNGVLRPIRCYYLIDVEKEERGREERESEREKGMRWKKHKNTHQHKVT